MFPPSIYKKYKEFSVFSNVKILVPSLGKIAAGGSDYTLLGTVSIGVNAIASLIEIMLIVRGNIVPGGKIGDGVTGKLDAYIRDVTINANPVANGGSANADPVAGAGITPIDRVTTAGLLSGVAPADKVFQNAPGFSPVNAMTAGDKLALDVALIRTGPLGNAQDPGQWAVANFEGFFSGLIYAAFPIP